MSALGLLGASLNEIQALKNNISILKSSLYTTEDVWNNEINKTNMIKVHLDSLRERISNPQFLNDLGKRIKKWRRKKVSRIKRLNDTKQLKEIALQRLKKNHDEIDNWRDSIIKKTLEEKEKAQMKLEADSILEEVRKKIAEAKKFNQRMTVLQKLRLARKENWIKKGMPINEESEEIFDKEIQRITRVIEERLETYDKEERTLQVMLKSEKDVESERIRIEKDEIKTKLWEKRMKNVKDCLFSPDNEYFICGDYSSYYVPSDIETLYSNRSSWDQFAISPQDLHYSSTSSIPIGWVMPPIPSSSTWELALERVDNSNEFTE